MCEHSCKCNRRSREQHDTNQENVVFNCKNNTNRMKICAVVHWKTETNVSSFTKDLLAFSSMLFALSLSECIPAYFASVWLAQGKITDGHMQGHEYIKILQGS